MQLGVKVGGWSNLRVLLVLCTVGIVIGASAYSAVGLPLLGSPASKAGGAGVKLMGSSPAGLRVDTLNLFPGATLDRVVVLMNPGTRRLRSIGLTVEATTRSLLDRDRRVGLRLRVDSCSQPWRRSASSQILSCLGKSMNLIRSRPVIFTAAHLKGLKSLSPGGVDHLRLRFMLPFEAGDEFQGKTSMLRWSFAETR